MAPERSKIILKVRLAPPYESMAAALEAELCGILTSYKHYPRLQFQRHMVAELSESMSALRLWSTEIR